MPDKTYYAGPKARKVVDVDVVPAHDGREVCADSGTTTSVSMRIPQVPSRSSRSREASVIVPATLAVDVHTEANANALQSASISEL